ncbi:MAG: hypothetical protein ACE5EC_05765 [Phycisphaerae bacterium]
MNPQLEMFAFNIRLLIGLLVCAALGFGLLIFSWTGLRAVLFNRKLKRAEKDLASRHHDAGGAPTPPTAPGVCQHCDRACDAVYHLPAGVRLCPACYQNRENG